MSTDDAFIVVDGEDGELDIKDTNEEDNEDDHQHRTDDRRQLMTKRQRIIIEDDEATSDSHILLNSPITGTCDGLLCEICGIYFKSFAPLEWHFNKYHRDDAVLSITSTDTDMVFRRDTIRDARISLTVDDSVTSANTAIIDDDEYYEQPAVLIAADDDDYGAGDAIDDDYLQQQQPYRLTRITNNSIVDPVDDVVQTVHNLHQQRYQQQRNLSTTTDRRRATGKKTSLRNDIYDDQQQLPASSNNNNNRQSTFVAVSPHRSMYDKRIRLRGRPTVATDHFIPDSHIQQHQRATTSSLALDNSDYSTRRRTAPPIATVRNKGGRPRSVRPRPIDDCSLFRCPSCSTVFQTDEACSIHQRAMHGIVYRSCY